MTYFKKNEPEITTDFNYYIGIPVLNWGEHPLALVSLLLGHYWAAHTLRVFNFERQIRLFLRIPSNNSRKVKRLKADLAFLQEQGLISIKGRYTILKPCEKVLRVNISYTTLQQLFSEPWMDCAGLCLVAYMAHYKMVRGVVTGLTADSTARKLRMGRKRLRKNVARLLEIGVLTQNENEIMKIKLYRKKKPRPLHQEQGNHEQNAKELRRVLMEAGMHDYEFGRDEDDFVMDSNEADTWYWLMNNFSGETNYP